MLILPLKHFFIIKLILETSSPNAGIPTYKRNTKYGAIGGAINTYNSTSISIEIIRLVEKIITDCFLSTSLPSIPFSKQ